MNFMPTLGWEKRLQAAIKAAGDVTAVKNGTSVSESALKRYMAGDGEPGAFKLAAVARFCGVSIEHILYGEEPTRGLYLREPSAPTYVTESDVDSDVVFIPLLEVIASAGPGIENGNPIEKDRLPFPRRWLELLNLPLQFARFLDSRGDSMTETIKEDAICLADIRFQRPRLDAIFVVVHNNDVRIKRIGRGMEGRITLISDNPRYETEILSEPEAKQLKIAGRIVWAGGRV